MAFQLPLHELILPSEIDLQHLEKRITLAGNDLIALNTRISDTTLFLTSLRSSRDAIVSHRAALVAQRDLFIQQKRRIQPLFATTYFPEEILSDIFVLVRDGEREDYEETKVERYIFVSSPIRISGTCRRWRDVALRTSTLWNFIQTNYWDELGDPESRCYAAMQHFLSHSGETGLSAVFDCVPYTRKSIRNNIPPFSILPLSRIYELQLRIDPEDEGPSLFSTGQPSFLPSTVLH